MTGDVSFSRSVKVAVAAVLDWKAVLLLAVIHKYLVGGGSLEAMLHPLQTQLIQ